MATTYTDQFFVMDPYAPPPLGSTMTVQIFDLVDQNDDDDIDRFNNDRVDGSDVRSSYPGDTITIDVPGVGLVTYTGITFYLADGREVFTPTDGQVLQSGILDSTSWVPGQGPLDINDLGPVCFVRGTMIETANGYRAIESLKPGDRIITRDNGRQPLLFMSHRRFAATGKEAPVRIRKGTLNNDADLWVSQQHRMLVTGWRAELFTGSDEVLVAAKHLVNGGSIQIVEGGDVEYYHLLFAQHEIVNAAGAPSESYHPEHAVSHGDRETLAEIRRLFPEICGESAPKWATARPVVRKHEGNLLAA